VHLGTSGMDVMVEGETTAFDVFFFVTMATQNKQNLLTLSKLSKVLIITQDNLDNPLGSFG